MEDPPFDTELTPKRLETFKDIIPSLQKVLLPYDVADRYSAQLPAYRAAARRLGVVLCAASTTRPAPRPLSEAWPTRHARG